jgi:hypothetical protein
MTTTDTIKGRMRLLAVDLDQYIDTRRPVKDLGHVMRGIDFYVTDAARFYDALMAAHRKGVRRSEIEEPSRHKEPSRHRTKHELSTRGIGSGAVSVELEDSAVDASAPGPQSAFDFARTQSGQRVFAGGNSFEDRDNYILNLSFSQTQGIGFREIPADLPSPGASAYPAGDRPAVEEFRPEFRPNSLFDTGQTAFSQGSLHVALDGRFCNIHIDKNVCFYSEMVASSFDIAPHTGSELILQAKLVPMILPVAFGLGGLYAGSRIGGTLASAHGGARARPVFGALGGAALGVAAGLIGNELNNILSRHSRLGTWWMTPVTDHISLKLPSTGDPSPYFGVQIDTPKFDAGWFTQAYVGANLLFDLDPPTIGTFHGAGVTLNADW